MASDGTVSNVSERARERELLSTAPQSVRASHQRAYEALTMNPRKSAIAVPYSVYWIVMPRNSIHPALNATVTRTSQVSSTTIGTSRGRHAGAVRGSREVIMRPACGAADRSARQIQGVPEHARGFPRKPVG